MNKAKFEKDWQKAHGEEANPWAAVDAAIGPVAPPDKSWFSARDYGTTHDLSPHRAKYRLLAAVEKGKLETRLFGSRRYFRVKP